MWLFTQKGFLSIVRHSDKPGILVVRSRFPNHIQSIFPSALVSEGSGSDYKYRAQINQKEVSQAIAKMIFKIDYPNFKNSLDMNEEGYLNCCYDVYEAVLKNSDDYNLENFIYGRREIDEKMQDKG